MRLIPLEIGRLQPLADLMGAGRAANRALPIPSWLIEHRDGLVLFDTGLHADLVHGDDKLGPNAQLFSCDFDAGEELTNRLATHAIRPGDITHLVFSHLHFDHVGGTAEIPDARVVVQESEWVAGHRPKLIEFGVYDPVDFDIGHELELIDGAHDVMGDGSIMCVPTPGHTIGHQSLRLELQSGPVVLTGDCVYFQQALDEMTVPSFGYDRELQLASMRSLAALRDDGCRLLYGHDEDQFRTLPTDGLV